MATEGYYVPANVAETIHDYLMSRPASETFDLILALRACPVARPPKAKSVVAEA